MGFKLKDYTKATPINEEQLLTRVDRFWVFAEQHDGEIQDVVVFSGFENLRGKNSNRDTFVVDAEGSVTGTIYGGTGGVDTLLVAKGSG